MAEIEPPRILVAGDFPTSPPTAIGGIQAVTSQLVAELAALDDVEVEVACCERFWHESGPRRSRQTLAGYVAHYCHSPQVLPHVVTSWTFDAAYVRHQAKLTGASLVHGHGLYGYAVGAIRSGRPHVITPHGMARQEKAASQGARGLSRQSLRERAWRHLDDWCLKHAGDLIVISPYVRSQIQPRTPGRLHMIDNPVDPAFFSLGGDATDQPGTLLTVGWLQPRKRHAELIEAYAEARRLGVTHRLRIVGNVEGGDENHLRYLRSVVKGHGLNEHVDFLRELSHLQLLAEYRRADVYIHAAAEESSPMAVAQAMAAELPVCAFDIPGLRHLVETDTTGVLVSGSAPAALGRCIAELAASADSRRAMGTAAGAVARDRFRPASVAARTRDVYAEILDRWRNARASRVADGTIQGTRT